MTPTRPQDQTIELSVRTYLGQVIEISTRWSRWLAEHEQTLLLGQYGQLESHAASAQELFAEITGLAQQRQTLLEESQYVIGTQSSSVSQLARALSAWRSMEFRELVQTAQRQMTHLKRLNLATWVLVSQCARMTNETVHLMIHGKPEASVYIDSPMADNRTGQLLDASA